MTSHPKLEPTALQGIRHWSLELVIVVIGVLLALWAQAWFEGRRDVATHRDTARQMDDLFRRALIQTAARVSSSDCARARLGEIDAALRSSDGQWKAMPLPNLPERMRVGHYPAVYVVDSDVLPLQIFDTARQNGTTATLAPDDRRFYEQVERELHWLNDVWTTTSEPGMRLSVLGLDGPLSDAARDELRQVLATFDSENTVTVLRAHALARLAREHGVRLSDEDVTVYRQKIERDRGFFGSCVVDVDPLQMTPK